MVKGMPHYEAQKECFTYINQFITDRMKHYPEGFDMRILVRTCLIKYPISEKAVRRFIEKSYVETKEITLTENQIMFLISRAEKTA